MAHYLLSVHTGTADAGEPPTEEQMRESMCRIGELEQDMKATGAWLFSGRLAEADTATVVRAAGDELLTTDGPYLESKEHVGGFYIITADDLDAALAWAGRVTAVIGAPIEVRPFAGVAG
jgi:hypothetical protein